MPAKTFNVTANVKDEDGNVIDTKKGAFSYEFGDNLKEAVAKFTEEVVFGLFVSEGTVRVQSIAREALKGGATPEDTQAKLDEYTLGLAKPRARKDPVAEAQKAYTSMTPEEKIAHIAWLQSIAKK